MEMTDAKVVEKKIYEDGKKEYASKGLAGTALGIGIGGLALALLNGNGRGVFGSLGNGMPDNVNINTYGGMTASNTSPTALEVMEKECADEVKLLTDMFGLKLDTANKFYAMRETDIAEKFGLYKSHVDAINAENRRAIDAEFGLYKAGRDQYDATNAKMAALETKIAVMEALAPYKEKILLQAMDLKTAYDIKGQLVLPSTPTVTGYGSYCCCKSASTPTTGA
ncbi:hypothetical protein [Leyella stercorea]|uniref:hypothetical protein n=1 Tax=Leyella stercorea TaxID=363265 RepID=UPI00242C7E88|nr:hypothetical protein [Leyella stercorea]